MKQTAVEWLTEKLRIEFGFAFSNNIFEQAKEMEKEQIIEAAYFGHLKGWVDCGVENSFGEEYYKETFKSE
jgi:hypothetical protein